MNPRSSAPGITVEGSGVAAAPVDQVTICLGVQILRPDAGEAFQTAAGTVTRLLGVLADDGVDARSVRTADLSLGPRTEWQENREVLVGYQASQQLIVRLTALSEIERLLSDVVARSGEGVRIDSVTLTAGHPEQAAAQAREAAFTAAKAKAEQYATLAGRQLGAVRKVQEQPQHGIFPMAASFKAESRDAGGSMPVAAGDAEVTASVTVTWDFAD